MMKICKVTITILVLLLLAGCTTGPEAAGDIPPTVTSIPTPAPTSVPTAPPVVPPQINMPSTIPLSLVLLAIFGMGTFVALALVVMNFLSKLINSDKEEEKEPEETFEIGPKGIKKRLGELEKINNEAPQQLADLEARGELLVGAIHDMMALANGLLELVQMYRDALKAIKGESMDYDALAELSGKLTKRDGITAARLQKPWLWNDDFRQKMVFNLHALAGSLNQAVEEQWEQVKRLDAMVQQYSIQEHDLWTANEISRTEAPSLRLTEAVLTIQATLADATKTLRLHRNRRERIAQEQVRYLPNRQPAAIDLSSVIESSKIVEMSDL